MTYWRKEKLKCDGLSVIALFLFLLWILVSVAWYRRYNPRYLLWFCDITLLMTAIGLFLHSGMLVTAQLTAILLFHTGWNLDFWLFLLCGYLPIGSTGYMFYHDLTLLEKSLSFFNHVFIVPLAFWGAYILGTPKRAWLVQCAQTFLIFLLTYFFTRPEENINWMFGSEVFNITPLVLHPIIYYTLMIILPPLVIYWPTNRMIIILTNKLKYIMSGDTHPTNFLMKNAIWVGVASLLSHVSILTTIIFIFFASTISVSVSHIADKKCLPDATVFEVKYSSKSPLEAIPLSTTKTRIDHIMFGERDSIREAPLFIWPSQELPKQWSGFDNKWHVHTKALLRDLKPEYIPSVPQELLIQGTRSVLWKRGLGFCCIR